MRCYSLLFLTDTAGEKVFKSGCVQELGGGVVGEHDSYESAGAMWQGEGAK